MLVQDEKVKRHKVGEPKKDEAPKRQGGPILEPQRFGAAHGLIQNLSRKIIRGRKMILIQSRKLL